jgi:hypothetical protein
VAQPGLPRAPSSPRAVTRLTRPRHAATSLACTRRAKPPLALYTATCPHTRAAPSRDKRVHRVLAPPTGPRQHCLPGPLAALAHTHTRGHAACRPPGPARHCPDPAHCRR